MDSGGASLGSVDVDVGANLDRLLKGFRDAELAADRFDKALERRVTQSSNNAARAAAALAAAEQRLGTSMDQAGRAADRYGRDVGRAGAASAGAARQVDQSAAQIRRTLMASASLIAAAFGANELKNLADGYTRFTNQLKVAGVASADLGDRQQSLFQVAQKYGVELESIGTLYGRVTQSSKELGASQKQTMDFTKGVAAALKVQGGAASESKGALLQLSQLLGAPMVQAQEFNSILDGARPIIQAVANGIDKYAGSIAKLRADILNGNVTSQDFFQGFLRGSTMLETQATQANFTIGASFTILTNALSKYVGEADKSLGATVAISAGIKALASNLDVIIPILAAIILAMGARYVAAAGRMIVSTALVDAAIFAVQARAAAAATTMEALAFAGTAAGRALLAAFGGPLGIAILAIAGAVYYFYQRAAEAEAQTKRFNASQRDAAELLKKEAALAKGAGSEIKALGQDHKTATADISAFAGATGSAARSLYELAKANRRVRFEALARRLEEATAVRNEARRNVNDTAQDSSSIARYGRLPETAAQADAKKRLADAQATVDAIGRAMNEAIKTPLDDEMYLQGAKGNPVNDLKAEIAKYQQQLVAANKAGNETAQRQLLAEIKLRQRILELMKQGLTLEVATSTAQAEKIKAPGRGGDRELFTGAMADQALSGIGATVTSGKRSRAQQQILYDRYKAGTGPLAAAPGTSAHENDQARDIRKTPGMTLDKIRNAIEGAGGQIKELLDEGTHFHVAWSKTARSAEQVAQDRLKNEQDFAGDLAKTNDEIEAAKQAQLVNEADIEKAERDRINKQAGDDVAANLLKMQRGQLTEAQAETLNIARNQLRDQQLAGVDLKERQRLESEARKTAEAAHDREMEGLEAQQDIARTAAERRMVERRILDAQEKYERAVLQAIIDSPTTKPLDRDLAKSELGGLGRKYSGRRGALNQQTRDDLLGTAPEGSESSYRDQAELIRTQEADKLAIIQEALDARLIAEEEFERRRLEIKTDSEAKIAELELARKEVQVAAASETADTLLSILEETAGKQSGIYKAMFIVTKAFAIAESIIKIQQALASATASLPFPANLPVIALVAAQGASIISSIMSVGAQFRGGGYTGDMPEGQVAGAVHGKEFVSHAQATKKYRPILEDMNAGRDPTARFQRAANDSGPGGMMGGSQRPISVEMKNYAPGVVHSVEQVDYDRVRIITREEAPKAVANDLARPNSPTRKALQTHTTARPRKS